MVEPIYLALLVMVFILGYYTRYMTEIARIAKLKKLISLAEVELKKVRSDAVLIKALGDYYKALIANQKQEGE